MSDRSKGPLFFLLIVTVVWSIVMQWQIHSVLDQPFPKPESCHFTGKILDVELARSNACFEKVVERGAYQHSAANVHAFRVHTYMDFAFILLYWAVFVFFMGELGNRLTKWVIGLISAAAVFDALENWRIIKCLDELNRAGRIQGMLPWEFSTAKWRS